MTDSPAVRKKNARRLKVAWGKLKRSKGPAERQQTFPKFMKVVDKYGIDPEFFTMAEIQDITKVVNDNEYLIRPPVEGDNSTREQFKHNPYFTLKGRFYQTVIKPMIRKAIHGAHTYWISKYDKDAFVYDDPRLQAVDELLKTFIDDHMAHREYKLEFMHEIRDIVFGVVKEDPYYASAFWVFCNKFVKKFPDGFEMNESEIHNWETHHAAKKND